jgi:hypothetical protein
MSVAMIMMMVLGCVALIGLAAAEGGSARWHQGENNTARRGLE